MCSSGIGYDTYAGYKAGVYETRGEAVKIGVQIKLIYLFAFGLMATFLVIHQYN
jgi:hypothetical protein